MACVEQWGKSLCYGKCPRGKDFDFIESMFFPWIFTQSFSKCIAYKVRGGPHQYFAWQQWMCRSGDLAWSR